MAVDSDAKVSIERLLGAELVRAAATLAAGLKPETLDPALAVRLATVQLLLDLYWKLRSGNNGLAGQNGKLAGLPADPRQSGNGTSQPATVTVVRRVDPAAR
jgi:hypothetical protein